MTPALALALQDFAKDLADAGFPKENAFKAIVFATAVYLENGAVTLKDQMRFLEAEDRESVIAMNKALEAIWRAVHEAA